MSINSTRDLTNLVYHLKTDVLAIRGVGGFESGRGTKMAKRPEETGRVLTFNHRLLYLNQFRSKLILDYCRTTHHLHQAQPSRRFFIVISILTIVLPFLDKFFKTVHLNLNHSVFRFKTDSKQCKARKEDV